MRSPYSTADPVPVCDSKTAEPRCPPRSSAVIEGTCGKWAATSRRTRFRGPYPLVPLRAVQGNLDHRERFLIPPRQLQIWIVVPGTVHSPHAGECAVRLHAGENQC